MADVARIARRTFLIGTAAITGGVGFGYWYVNKPYPNPLAKGLGKGETTFNPYNAMASAVNVLGDVHGGAGEQAVELFTTIAARIDNGQSLSEAVAAGLDEAIAAHGKFVSGFGHRFHPIDPRAPRLLELVDLAAKASQVSGRYATIARAVESELAARKGGRRIPMNIDGATAVIYAELGFPAPLARGLFCLSRSVGILAHAWEQTLQGGRNKGPIPRTYLWTYDGEPERRFPPGASE